MPYIIIRTSTFQKPTFYFQLENKTHLTTLSESKALRFDTEKAAQDRATNVFGKKNQPSVFQKDEIVSWEIKKVKS